MAGKSLIDDVKSEIFSKSGLSDSALNVQGSQTDLELLYSNFLYNGSETNKKYHENAIKTAEIVLKVAMIVFVAVTVFIAIVICILLSDDRYSAMQILVPLVVSSVVDLLAATIIWTMKSLLKSKNAYFEKSINGEELSKIIGLIRSMPESTSKNEMISKLVCNFCTNSKPKTQSNAKSNKK